MRVKPKPPATRRKRTTVAVKEGEALAGDVENDEKTFDQILSTFEFTAAKDEEKPGSSISVQMVVQNDTGESGTAVFDLPWQ